MKNSDLPAMPQPIAMNETECLSIGDHQGDNSLGGLTKREMIAIHAMQGIVAHSSYTLDRGRAARSAVEFADALLKELEK